MKFIKLTLLASILIFSCGSESTETNTQEQTSEFTDSSSKEITDKIDSTKVGFRNVEEYLGEGGTNDSVDKELREIEPVKLKEKKTVVATPKPIIEKEKIEIIKDEVEVITEMEAPEKPQVKAEIHKTWDDLTRKHISSSGKVNYAGFKADNDEIVKYIKELQSYHKDLSSWGKNKRLAYWINVYNVVTVKLIVDNYPVKSIQDLHGGKPWDQKLINLGGTSYTLNVIENKIIRPKFNEPRIHFAVNCAANSCPKILNIAWTEDNIQRYLTKQTKAFIANTTQNTIGESELVLSNIFNWYKADFGTSNENVIKFINKYSDIQVKPDAVVTYNDYDWSLNN
ncbi:MAG: DUF547 domain-containing protein [Flavobacteriales bacterium]